MPWPQRAARPDDLDDFATELHQIESESPFGTQSGLDRRLDAIDDMLAPAEAERPFALAPPIADDPASADTVRDGRWAVVGMAGLLLLLTAAGACAAILLLHDRLSRILR